MLGLQPPKNAKSLRYANQHSGKSNLTVFICPGRRFGPAVAWRRSRCITQTFGHFTRAVQSSRPVCLPYKDLYARQGSRAVQSNGPMCLLSFSYAGRGESPSKATLGKQAVDVVISVCLNVYLISNRRRRKGLHGIASCRWPNSTAHFDWLSL